jgi:hypothetical protein
MCALAKSPAALVGRIPLLVIDVSQSGCLLESRLPVSPGRVATVRIMVNARCYVENVRVTRCQLVSGQGSTYHVGVEFLRTRRHAEHWLPGAAEVASGHARTPRTDQPVGRLRSRKSKEQEQP